MTHATLVRYGGSIDVLSEFGKGTRFLIRLPAVKDSLPEKNTEKDQSSEQPPATGGRLLIVDDEEIVLRVLGGLLSLGHETRLAKNGQEALQGFELGRHDVAIIDLGLPGKTGDELCLELKAADPSLVTVLMTGWKVKSGDPRAAGFDFHLQKPFVDLETVERIVCDALALHRERARGRGERFSQDISSRGQG